MPRKIPGENAATPRDTCVKMKRNTIPSGTGAKRVFDEFITQEFLGRLGGRTQTSPTFLFTNRARTGLPLMNGFLREERLNSRVTVLLPGDRHSGDRRSDFARFYLRATRRTKSEPRQPARLSRYRNRLNFPPVTIFPSACVYY